MVKYPLAAILVMAASVSTAQVRVIDSQPTVSNTPPPPAPAGSRETGGSAASSDRIIELYYQLQNLQQEVQQLRGLVEEQTHEIRRLKQQRMDDYLDLDRRLNQLSQGGASTGNGSQESQTSTNSANGPAGKGELADYRAAIDLVLKDQDYDRGIVALEQHLADYPNGRYAGNAKYWLGQIYMLRNQLEKSRQWFVDMLEDHADHQKAPEAKFKLGRVYDLLGDKQKARSLLEEVARSDTSAAGLAKEYLRQNFSS